MELRDQLRPTRAEAPRSNTRGTGGGSATSRAGHRAGPRTDSSARASGASAPSLSVSATASHSGPLTRSRIDVAQQQPARIRVEVGQDLLAEVVDDVPVIPANLTMNSCRSVRLRSDNPARYTAAGQPSAR